jgi:hypothetical protein
MREKLRRLNDDPMWMKLSTERQLPSFPKERSESEEPQWMKLMVEQPDPKRVKPHTDMEDPSLTALRTASALPSAPWSRIDVDPVIRAPP